MLVATVKTQEKLCKIWMMFFPTLTLTLAKVAKNGLSSEKYHNLFQIPHNSKFKTPTRASWRISVCICVNKGVVVVRLCFLPYLMLWTFFMISRQMWKPPSLLFVAPVWEMRYFITEISTPAEGQLQEKKRYTRAACEVPISSCEVCMINPTLQIVAEGDLVCAFPGFCFPAVETKDEWTYRGYYGVSPFSITIGAGWLW